MHLMAEARLNVVVKLVFDLSISGEIIDADSLKPDASADNMGAAVIDS